MSQNTPMAAKGPLDLSEGQRAALIRLLDDDAPTVLSAVRGKILSYGESAIPWLQAHRLEPDPVVRQRVGELVEEIARKSTDNEFLSFCVRQGEDFDLEEAVWMLARTRYPEINLDAYRALLDSYVADLRKRLPESADARQVLETINGLLFTELGYRGNEGDYYDPDNSYLNRVIDRRTGNPISLCAVYLFVARRLRLPVVGIGMPGHFLCRHQSSTAEIYIDAFHQGRLLSKADCVRYLLQSSYGFQEGLLSPATPRRILLRMCSNLHQVYLHLKLKEEISRLQRYVVALAK